MRHSSRGTASSSTEDKEGVIHIWWSCYWKGVCVQRLATQKPINMPGWWRDKFVFISDAGNWGGRRVVDAQRPTPGSPTGETSGAGAFTDRRRGLPAETAQSALPVIWELVVGGLTYIIMVVLGTVNQFQSPFIPISLRPVLGIVAAHVLGTV